MLSGHKKLGRTKQQELSSAMLLTLVAHCAAHPGQMEGQAVSQVCVIELAAPSAQQQRTTVPKELNRRLQVI